MEWNDRPKPNGGGVTMQKICSEPKFQIRSIFLFSLILSIAGCSGGDNPENTVNAPPIQANPANEGVVSAPGNQSPHRYFEYPFFEPESCPADPIINCSADLAFCEDGTSFILLTDIINIGTYTETGSTIVTNWGVGDVPPTIVFTVQSDGTVTDDIFGFVWEPVTTGFC